MTSPAKNDIGNDWHSFLRRDPPPERESLRKEANAALVGKRILITGAGGYIGSAVARSMVRAGAREIVLFDSSEGALYDAVRTLADLKNPPPHIPVLANVCDPEAIRNVFEQHEPEIVFHAAAFKHVPLMESNPFAAVANNALGTYVLAEAATKYGCEQMLMVSTDKAVVPSSIMGASKRIAELILLSPRIDSVRMKVVRLGNVLGSSGSVVPLFQQQIAGGGAVTVSHPDARRYFMTLTEAVDSIQTALSLDSSSASALFIPELGEPIRILDLAKFMIGETGVPIVFTELRPGDKMEESLISQDESYEGELSGSLRKVRSPTLSSDELSALLQNLQVVVQRRDLSQLLEAVQQLVPDYRPSLMLRQNSSIMVDA